MSEQISTDALVRAIIANLTFYENDTLVENSSLALLCTLCDWKIIGPQEYQNCVDKIDRYLEDFKRED